MKSLRARLALSFTALLAAAVIVFGVIVWLVAREAMQRDVDDFLRSKAMLLGRLMSPTRMGIEPWIEQDMQVQERQFMLQVFDANGTFKGKSSNLATAIPLSDEARRSEHPAGNAVIETTYANGRAFRVATHPRRDLWGDPVMLYAQTLMPLDTIQAREHRLMLWLTGCGIITLASGAAAAWFLSSQWLRSVSTLEEAARSLSTGDLGKRRLFAPSGDPELAALAAAFNHLLDRLESSHTAQQRFTADASHELRTPLTVLRGEIEVALRRPRNADEYREVLLSSREEIERLSRLTENMLALAHVDVGDAITHREQVEVVQLCRDSLSKFQPLADEKQIRLHFESSCDSCTMSGDRLALERVMQNLIENAIRYSPSGESVIVRLSPSDRQLQFDVIDSGSGIAPEHLPHLFERFYRVDKARSRAHGGSGLGLSIVRALVEAHGGTVTVASVVGKGSTFTVRLPVM